MIGYVKAFFDAEGSVSVPKVTAPTIVGTNTEYLLVSKVRSYLKQLGIESRLRGPYGGKGRNKLIYKLVISRKEDLCKYYDLVGFYHPKKQKKLIDALLMPTPRVCVRCKIKPPCVLYKIGQLPLL